jgi:hypothetical protein
MLGRSTLRVYVLVVFVVAAAGFTLAQTNNWLGGAGNWSNGAQWSLGLPNSGSDVLIYSGGNDNVTLDVGSTIINSLTVGGANIFNFSQLTDNGIAQTLAIANAMNIGQDGLLQMTAGSAVTVGANSVNAGGIILSGGSSLTVTGLVNTGGVIVSTNSSLNLTNQPNGITDAVQGSSFRLSGSFTAGVNQGFANLNSIEGTVLLFGQSFAIATGSGTLTVGNTGFFNVDTNANLVASTITINGNVLNQGQFDTGSYYNGGPGSTLTVNGSLINENSFWESGQGYTVTAYTLTNNGYATVDPSNTLILTNQPNGITDALGGSSFDLYGTFTAGSNPGFANLNSIEGSLQLFDQNFTITPGSSTLTISNTGYFNVDSYTGAGSNITIKADVNNSGYIATSDYYGNGPSTLTITGRLTNNAGAEFIVGGPGDQIFLGSLMNGGDVFVGKGATLTLTNQPLGVTDIPQGSSFRIFGTFDAGGNNAFANLASVEGLLRLRNHQTTSITPMGGAALTVSDTGRIDVTNACTMQVNGDLTNAGLLTTSFFGGGNLVNPNQIIVTGTLTNKLGGNIHLYGNSFHSDVAMASSLVNQGTVIVGTNAVLDVANGITDVVAGSTFDLAGTFNAGANNGFHQLTSVEGNLILENGQTTTVAPTTGTLTIASGGAVHVLNNSTLFVNGNGYSNIDLYGYLGLDPSTVIVSGSLILEPGSTLNLASGDMLQVGNIVNKGAFGVPGGATIQTAYFLSSAQTTLNPLAALLVGTGTAGNTGYYQLANGTLGEFIDASGFGVIVVNGPVHLDGTLDIQLGAGFNPAVGSTYDFITFASGSYDGSVFASILNGVFNNGTEKWVVIYNSFGGNIELMAQANNQPTPEPTTLLLLGSALGVGWRLRRKSRG